MVNVVSRNSAKRWITLPTGSSHRTRTACRSAELFDELFATEDENAKAFIRRKDAGRTRTSARTQDRRRHTASARPRGLPFSLANQLRGHRACAAPAQNSSAIMPDRAQGGERAPGLAGLHTLYFIACSRFHRLARSSAPLSSDFQCSAASLLSGSSGFGAGMVTCQRRHPRKYSSIRWGSLWYTLWYT